MKTKHFASASAAAVGLAVAALSSHGLAAQAKPVVIEEIVARVNNSIITLADYQAQQKKVPQEVQQECACAGLQLQNAIQDRQKNVLRDMIDQELLIERAKDMSLDVETEVIKRLDDLRKQNNMPTLEAFQRAVESDGQSWDDLKSQLKNSLLTNEVIRREVGGRIDVGPADVKAYYDAHKSEFNRPEEVVLSEIILSTENKTGADIDAVKKRAEDLRARVIAGEDFGELAKRYSEDSTSVNGGALGVYTKGQMPQQLEDAVFKLSKGQMSDVIQTKSGFMILRVDEHYQAGDQPLEAVQEDIQQKIFMQKMDPQLRKYLEQLREQSYVFVKAGYTDSDAITGGTMIQEVAPTPDTPDKKAKKKLPLPKVSG